MKRFLIFMLETLEYRNYSKRSILINLLFFLSFLCLAVFEGIFGFINSIIDLSPVISILIALAGTILVLLLTLSDTKKEELKSYVLKSIDKDSYNYLLYRFSFILLFLFATLIYYIVINCFSVWNHALEVIAVCFIFYSIFDTCNSLAAVIVTIKK